jgi:hypothetical protein
VSLVPRYKGDWLGDAVSAMAGGGVVAVLWLGLVSRWLAGMLGALLVVLLLSGCASTAYKHPTTSAVRACRDDRPSIWQEMFCVPCYYAAQRRSTYYDCQQALEAQGYVRQ